MFSQIENKGLVKLLKQMVHFNPCFRPTAEECLKSSVFDSIRVPEHEKASSFMINLPIYEDGQYDYENCVSLGCSRADFIKMVYDESIMVK